MRSMALFLSLDGGMVRFSEWKNNTSRRARYLLHVYFMHGGQPIGEDPAAELARNFRPRNLVFMSMA